MTPPPGSKRTGFCFIRCEHKLMHEKIAPFAGQPFPCGEAELSNLSDNILNYFHCINGNFNWKNRRNYTLCSCLASPGDISETLFAYTTIWGYTCYYCNHHTKQRSFQNEAINCLQCTLLPSQWNHLPAPTSNKFMGEFQQTHSSPTHSCANKQTTTWVYFRACI